jgi:S1-C subfamily serine protease
MEIAMGNADDPKSLRDLSGALSELVARSAPAVVTVYSERLVATGFVWRPGLVVTADEALADEGDFVVSSEGDERRAAQLVGRDPTTDIALLRVAQLQGGPISFRAMPPTAGELAVVVGAEDGDPTAALGMVARVGGPWRSMRGGAMDARIELDVNLRRSAEGGLVLNAAGEALGMAVFGPRRRVLVIPSATIERVASALERSGRIARGYLGLGLQRVALPGGGAGVMVMSVDPAGPGAAAGLHQGDVLVTWNGEPIRHVPAVLRALGPDSVGRTITLGVRRAGEERTVTIVVAERPDA